MLQYTNFKYCPKCGSIDLITHETNGVKCISCGFVYFHNTASAVAALIETPSGILFVERNHDPHKGFLDVPGGFVNYKESLEDALRREIMEELSLNLQSIEYFGSFPNTYKYEKITYFTTDVFFKCKFSSDIEVTPNDEISKYLYYTKDNLPFDQFAFESTKSAFTYYKSLL